MTTITISIFLAFVITFVRSTSVTKNNIDEKLRLLGPIMMMFEDIVKLENINNCLEKTFCLLETTETSIDEDNPLKHFSRFLTNTHKDFDEVAAEKFAALVQKFPHVSKIVDAIVTGQIANNSKSCHMTYGACKVEEEYIIRIVSGFVSEIQNARETTNIKRDICDNLGVTCGVAASGCAVCAAATELICGAGCAPAIAAGCGGLAIGCAISDLLG